MPDGKRRYRRYCLNKVKIVTRTGWSAFDSRAACLAQEIRQNLVKIEIFTVDKLDKTMLL